MKKSWEKSSRAATTKFVRQLIQKYYDSKASQSQTTKIAVDVNDTLHRVFTELLDGHHHSQEKKGSGIKQFYIQLEPSGKGLEAVVQRTDGTEDVFSVAKAIKVRGRVEETKGSIAHADLYKAMRHAVEPQQLLFKKKHFTENESKCALCSKALTHWDEVEADHAELQCYEIVRKFLDGYAGKVPSLFGENERHGKRFLGTDSTFAEMWASYHAEAAVLQLVCRPCNAAKPRLLGMK